MRLLVVAALSLLAVALGQDTEECEKCEVGPRRGEQLLQGKARQHVGSVDAGEEEEHEFDPQQLTVGDPSSLSTAVTYIEKLAQKHAGHHITITPEEKQAIETVRQFILGMGTTSDTQHAEDQAEVDQQFQLIKQCGDRLTNTLLPAIAAIKSQMEAARTEHANCRIQETTDGAVALAACKRYDDFRLVSPGLPDCACTKLNQDGVRATDPVLKQQMEGCLEDTNTFVIELYEYYKACKDAKGNLTHCSDTCDDLQKQFEESYCMWAFEATNTCDSAEVCHASAVETRNQTYLSVSKCEAARKADYKTGEYVKCLLDIFHTDNSGKAEAFTACQASNPVDDSKYDINYPGIPALPPCERAPSKPCDSDWVAQEYSSQPWYGAVSMAPCSPCPAPAPVIAPPPKWKTTPAEKMKYLDFIAYRTIYPIADQQASREDFMKHGWDQETEGTGITFNKDGQFVTLLDTVLRPFRNWQWFSTTAGNYRCTINIFGSNTAWTKEGDWTQVATAEMVSTGIGPCRLQNIQPIDRDSLFGCWKLEWVSTTVGDSCPMAGWFKWVR